MLSARNLSQRSYSNDINPRNRNFFKKAIPVVTKEILKDVTNKILKNKSENANKNPVQKPQQSKLQITCNTQRTFGYSNLTNINKEQGGLDTNPLTCRTQYSPKIGDDKNNKEKKLSNSYSTLHLIKKRLSTNQCNFNCEQLLSQRTMSRTRTSSTATHSGTMFNEKSGKTIKSNENFATMTLNSLQTKIQPFNLSRSNSKKAEIKPKISENAIIKAKPVPEYFFIAGFRNLNNK